MECSLKAGRINLGAGIYPPGGSVKYHGQRSLQIVALGSASGAPMEITNPSDRTAMEAAGKGREGLGKGECNLLRKNPWWTPIFKFGKAEDLQSGNGSVAAAAAAAAAESDGRARRTTVFTEEKARALRRELRETETWHDLMYHSAIASRLAISD
ncbi:uncharacterized protein LOC131065121 [Cryptomeria japonica]|uniref:uncharacterized protein LOC131065121 n=1 Tax=Cryptomeria japonica TaxID=3369 RepID=UPI0027DA0E39|nr:uncharacterized protein LOC131065121 [Cryptomeria japonica]